MKHASEAESLAPFSFPFPNFPSMIPFIAAIKLLRPINLILGALSVLITAVLMPAWPPWSAIGWTIATVMLYNAAANALNDYFDYPIDKINRPARPLASGVLPRNMGWVLALVLFIGGTFTAFQLPTTAQIVAIAIALPLMVLYTPLFKGLPLVGNLVVAVILGLAFLFAGAAFGHLALMWTPFGLAAGFTLLREAVKDIEDVAGDTGGGVGTLPVRWGVPPAVKTAQILTLLLMFGCLLPYILQVYGPTYLVAVIIGVEVPLLYTFVHLYNHPNPAGAGWVAKVLKVDIFAGLLAIYLSKFDV
ncbi:MAG: geranylgeranylglycerol-phosphate geranylgeranyltransferase [Fidelibacterota bacterium]|nr:MAG: geranylgeranylglycerol-phosphate geranylgeranyltransferase [Candidatus Neomarinimicrobiota bacterium]